MMSCGDDFEIVGLDADDADDILYIRHQHDEKVFTLNRFQYSLSGLLTETVDADPSVLNDPGRVIVINTQSPDALYFITNYMAFCDLYGKEEQSPERPLYINFIHEIFGSDWEFFQYLVSTSDVEDAFDVKGPMLASYTNLALYLKMDKLIDKLCCIIAYYVTHISKEKLSETLII